MKSKNEILDSLKTCLNSECSGCVYQNYAGDANCSEVLYEDVENLIELIEVVSMDKAWETARKLWLPTKASDLKPSDIKAMFGTVDFAAIMNTVSPAEAVEKIEALEESKKKICVGDVLEWDGSGVMKLVIATKIEGNYVSILMHDGFCGMAEKINLRKTGKHIDLAELFQQIGESA